MTKILLLTDSRGSTLESFFGDETLSYLVDMKGMDLYRWENSLKQHITTPTRLTGFNSSCIDLIISNITNSLIESVGTLTDAVSDHLPVFICIKKKRSIK